MLCASLNIMSSTRPVQISMDKELLKAIDRDADAKRVGRSAFVRAAVRAFLKAKRRREIDDEIRRAYRGKGEEMLEEIADLIEVQTWPED